MHKLSAINTQDSILKWIDKGGEYGELQVYFHSFISLKNPKITDLETKMARWQGLMIWMVNPKVYAL